MVEFVFKMSTMIFVECQWIREGAAGQPSKFRTRGNDNYFLLMNDLWWAVSGKIDTGAARSMAAVDQNEVGFSRYNVILPDPCSLDNDG